jgi:hypothetical protein
MLISILVWWSPSGESMCSPRLCHDLVRQDRHLTEPRVFGYLKRRWSRRLEDPIYRGGKDALNLDFTPRFAEQMDAFEESMNLPKAMTKWNTVFVIDPPTTCRGVDYGDLDFCR